MNLDLENHRLCFAPWFLAVAEDDAAAYKHDLNGPPLAVSELIRTVIGFRVESRSQEDKNMENDMATSRYMYIYIHTGIIFREIAPTVRNQMEKIDSEMETGVLRWGMGIRLHMTACQNYGP